MHHTAILLAAGRSERMGRNKLLLDWREQSLVRHIAEVLLHAEIQTVAVLGYQADLVQAALCNLPLQIVRNESFREGMGTSIAAGVAAASPNTDAFLIVLGDMPNLSSTLLSALAAKADRARIVVPRSGSREGNPVCFGAEFREELESLAGDWGARSVVDANRARVTFLDWPEESAFADLDRPEDIER